jgi:hypothetical protein
MRLIDGVEMKEMYRVPFKAVSNHILVYDAG